VRCLDEARKSWDRDRKNVRECTHRFGGVLLKVTVSGVVFILFNSTPVDVACQQLIQRPPQINFDDVPAIAADSASSSLDDLAGCAHRASSR